MCAWHLRLFLEAQEACLYDRNYAHGAAGRCVMGGDEVASAALPRVSGRPSQARVARTPTVSANWSGRVRGPVAFADDYFALGPKVDLSKQGRARLLRRVGKRAGGSADDKGPVADSVRDIGSMPCAQTAMDAHATHQRAASGLRRRTGASSAKAALASDDSLEAAQVGWCSAAAFSYPVRRFAPSRCFGCGAKELPFAAFSPTYEPRTGSCRACLRRSEQPGDRRKRPVECANGEKAPSRGLPQTRSPQPQPAYDADALKHHTARFTRLASCGK